METTQKDAFFISFNSFLYFAASKKKGAILQNNIGSEITSLCTMLQGHIKICQQSTNGRKIEVNHALLNFFDKSSMF